MENFELVDDYLANRLSEQDKQLFEQKLEGDPNLKKEVDFQRQIVEGVKHARAVQLKNMLNNVPVGGSVWTAGKLATAVVSAGVVATFMYLYINDDNSTNIASNTQTPLTEEVAAPADVTKEEPTSESTAIVVADSTATATTVPTEEQSKTKKKSSIKKEKVTTPVRKPDIQVVDPSEELSTTEEVKESSASARGSITVSKMEVITSPADKKHTFHYQFVQGKLMLFGPFDKSLYEILEIHGDGHAVFLYYKENYYLLDESQSTITALQPIREVQLLKKLKEYHGR